MPRIKPLIGLSERLASLPESRKMSLKEIEGCLKEITEPGETALWRLRWGIQAWCGMKGYLSPEKWPLCHAVWGMRGEFYREKKIWRVRGLQLQGWWEEVTIARTPLAWKALENWEKWHDDIV